MKIKNIIIILTIIVIGCKDEFLLETKNHEPTMVVDGMISNEPGPYTIKLSLDSPIPIEEKVPIEGCTVTLYENSDKSEVLTETEPGVYVTSGGEIQGVVGNKYSISITTPEGKEYKTEPQEMKEPVEIDSVYGEFTYQQLEGFIFNIPGYQFYVDSKMAQNQVSYILWNMTETFQYTADYVLEAIYNGNEILIDGADILTKYKDVYRCWKTQNSGYIATARTANLSNPQITHQPLYFVGTNSRKLQERFSLLLTQYTISENAYLFWKNIEDQISQENFLIAKQPYNIPGNVKNINNSEELVYGYFNVASVDQKRIFVDPPNASFYYEICYQTWDYEAIFAKGPFPKFLITRDNGQWAAVQESCVDCTFRGGEATKPDFWIDK